MLKTFVSISLFAFFTLQVSAAHTKTIKLSDVTKAAESVTETVYPNADIVVIDETISTTYQTNGTYTTTDNEYIKILTEKGKRSYRTISKYYTIPYGTATVVNIELINPAGKVTPIDVVNNRRVMVNPGQMSANIYNPNSKILQVGVPGIEIGDIIHIESYDETVKARVPDTWCNYNVLEHTSPILHTTINVDGPKEMPLVNIKLRAEIPGTVSYTKPTGKGDRNHYRWEIKDVPRMFPEPKMPDMYTVVQRLLVSTINDWESISRWYWNLSEPHLNAVTPDMKKKVAELTEGITDRDEKIRKIFRFVSQQIRYMGITTETTAPGYEPHDVSLTFNNRYGVCRDKAALLVAMLRLADIEAYPVLINAGPRKDEDVPQPYFNHAIAAVSNEDGSYTLMDSTDENTTDLMPAYLSFMSYLVAHPKGEHLRTSPVVPAKENLLSINTTGSLSADGLLKLKSRIDFNGINDNAYRGSFATMKPEERKQYFEGALKKRIAGAKLIDFTISPDDMQDTTENISVTLEYEAPHFPITSDNYTILAAPWLGTAFGYANFLLGSTGLNERKYPYYIRLTAGVKENINVKLDPALGQTASLPDSNQLNTSGVSFNQNVNIASNILTGSASFMINTVQFSPLEYIELKQFLKDREYEQRKKIILSNTAKANLENDIRILSDDSKITITDKNHWTSVTSIRTKILTYAGKKSNSEIKIGFNPIWESVRLVAASVENTDGTIHTVVDDEKNLMDASWVGSAPRYPPARTLVISLPGVEKGSIVSYTIEHKVFGKPFMSMQKTFRGSNPVDSSSVVITAPVDLPLLIDSNSSDISSSTNRSGDKITYSWKSGRQTAIKSENSLPPKWSFLPTLFISTGNWTNYASAVNAKLKAASENQDKCRLKAMELVADKTTPHDKIIAIRDFVATNIRNAGPSIYSLPLQAISKADTVLSDGYGNASDKAVITAALLNAVGIQSEFVLVSSWSPKVDALTAPMLKTPRRPLFNYVLVKVIDGSKDIYLGATDQYSDLGTTPFAGMTALNMDGTPFTINLPPQMNEKSMMVFNLTLDDQGNTKIDTERRLYGMQFAAKNKMFSELPPEELRRYFMELKASLSQAAEVTSDLKTDFSNYPGTRKFSVNIPRYAVRSGKYLYLTLPGGSGLNLSLKSDSRENDLYIPSPAKSSITYNITLPPNTKAIQMLPPKVDWMGPSGFGTIKYNHKISKDQRHITLTQEVNLNPAVIRAEEYPSLLELNRRLEHPDTYTILLEMEK